MKHSPVLGLLLLLMATCDCQNHVFYIRPSDSSHCPQEVNASHCYDLTTLVSEGHLSTTPNISLLFLPGEHFLEQDLNITNTEEFQMTRYFDKQGIKSVSNVKIACTRYNNYGGHSIRIQNVSLVKINSLSFQFCGVELVSVDHSEITDCKWNKSRSSAISIQDSNSVILDCQFMNGNCSDCSGGGIFAVHSNVTFTGSNVVTNNSVEGNGGGLSLIDSNVLIEGNLTVDSNVASGSPVIDCSYYFPYYLGFIGTLKGIGGGMYVENCVLIKTNTILLLFENNRAVLGGGVSIHFSHAVFNGHVEFSGNNAVCDGGGIAVSSFSYSTFNEQVEFSSNAAGIHGGGMIVMYNSHSIFNKQVEFSSNGAGNRGGGIIVWDNSHSIFNKQVEFSGNSAGDGAGGMLVWCESHSTFNEKVEFSGNSAGDSGPGGGIAVLYYSQNIFNGHTEIVNNSAADGGGIEVQHYSRNMFNGHTEIVNNTAADGGGMSVSQYSQCTFHSTVLFSGNSARISGGSLLADIESNITFLSEVNILTSTAGWEGGGILVRDDSLLEMSGQTNIKDNHASFYGGAISMSDFSKLRIGGRSFITRNSAHYGGAIHAASSKVYIDLGDHHFENNSADFGGALSLTGGSPLILQFLESYNYVFLKDIYFSKFLSLYFISNHAEEYGGAIWVEESPYYSCTNNIMIDYTNRCFIEYEYTSNFAHYGNSYYYSHEVDWLQNLTDIVSAVNNTAISGSVLYGGNIDSCVSLNENENDKPFDSIVNESTHSSLISSDPKQVCLCSSSNEPDCSITNHHIQAFSGQQFPLSLVGVGQRKGTVPAVILSHTNPLHSSNYGSETQSATGDCSELFYTITSDQPSVELLLYPESLCSKDSLSKLTVAVMIKPCPPGFMLHNQTKSCTCDDILRKLDENIQCDINSQQLSHEHGIWIGYDQLNDLNETVVYHPHCPFDYCRQELSNFTLNSSDDQCRYNRSGLICGACSEGYSLTLGGSKCRECSHVYLVLLIPLALAGVVLVLFLLILKLTVSMGTINGLIFFANIIGSNSSIFLPPESTVVLRVFIAWLNLDLGIDTCLFDGLDMYIKVWLQFIFPFYVFTLIGIIIFVSHYSIFTTKYLGSDPVAVLATLILVAYTKLLRAVLTVMSFTYIQGFDGSSITVWLYDGNVRYLSGKHIPLFVFALLIMLLLIIPYTVILLFSPYLQRYSKNRVLFWINDNRLKPFLLSYYAPLKDKYRSWIGLLLVLRLCLLVVFVSNSLGDPSINLLAIVVVVIVLFSWRMLSGTVYTNWCLDALEIFFLMKLGLFSVATLYVLHTSGDQSTLADTFVGAAFIVFVAITVYHGWRQLTDSRWWRLTLKPKWHKYFNLKNEEDPEIQENGEADKPQQKCSQVPTTVIELPQVPTTSVELREPVLEYC